jgi:hypothetical protein
MHKITKFAAAVKMINCPITLAFLDDLYSHINVALQVQIENYSRIGLGHAVQVPGFIKKGPGFGIS